MRAAVYYNNRDVRVEEVPCPVIKDGEILVRVEASGVCGSDVMEWYRIKKAPLVLGHEIAGTIAETGKGVEKFRVGMRVTVSHHVPCNTCLCCLAGNHTVCDTLRTTNFHPGGFAEYVRVPAINVDRGVFELPPNVSFEQGSFSEPLGCVVRGFRAAGFTPGKNVFIIGSGISGLLHVKLAKALGAGFIAATDINDFRLSMAQTCGADIVIPSGALAAKAMKDKSGRLADIVFLCAAADSAIACAVESVERGGTILVFAPKEPDSAYPMPMWKLWKDGITIKNTYASAPLDTQTALDLMAAKRLDVHALITHRLPLAEASFGFSLVAEAKDSLKVIIEPQK